MFEDCWRTVELFMRIANQWRTESGMRIALDYTAVRNTFGMLGLDVSVEEFDGITVMERAALGVWAAEAEARRQR